MIDVRLGLREINALYQAGVISPVPFPEIAESTEDKFSKFGRDIWSDSAFRVAFREESSLFSEYLFLRSGISQTVEFINQQWEAKRKNIMLRFSEVDLAVSEAYGIDATIANSISVRNYDLFSKSFPVSLTTEQLESEQFISCVISRLVGLDISICNHPEKLKMATPDDYIAGCAINDSNLAVDLVVRDCFVSEQIVDEFDSVCAEVFDKPDIAFSEILKATGFKSILDYVNNPNGFFSSHLNRYSKSRRKAPIYWPLSTTSGSYTLWIYYPSLNNQTLFKAVNDFLDGHNGKLTQVSRECAELRVKGSGRSRDEEKQYETLQTFEQELTDLRDTLLKIAPTYQPNHDDGVQITAAPLWPLFRHKPWQKVLKDTWTKLEKGDYDWAHLAMAYWPDRVREKCKTDKSLAIAHGLEDLYVETEAAPKKTRGKKKLER